MTRNPKWTIGFAIATFSLSLSPTLVQARADDNTPRFRPRTDANAKRDLELLREALNRATDVDGPINPLGDFQARNSAEIKNNLEETKPEKSLPLEFSPKGIGKAGENSAKAASDDVDREAEKKPTINLNATKSESNAKGPGSNRSTSIAELPGPHYTIVQNVVPQYSRSYVDDFRPSVQYPVSLAASTIPWRGESGNYVSNFQDVNFATPGVSSGGGVFPPSGVSGAPITGIPSNPVLPDASALPPTLSPGPLPSGPIGGIPLTNPNVPITNPPAFNAGNYNPPNINQPAPQPYYPSSQPGMNPGLVNPGNPMRSPSDAMPTYTRESPMVNGLPFVSGAPCQFDARYMVSQNVYRQSGDPCAPTRCAPNSYASQPGGSPYSYVPPTYMPYNNNGYESGYRPLIGFGQTLTNASLGRGIIGQPVAYVDGQPLRNFVRYLFP